MTSIHCISTANQFEDTETENETETEEQSTLSYLTSDVKYHADQAIIDSTQTTKDVIKTSHEMFYDCDKKYNHPFSPFSMNETNRGNLIHSSRLSSIRDRQNSFDGKTPLAPTTLQQNENQLTEEEHEEEEDEEEEDFPSPRQKSNTFTSGYISAHIPCEQKKSRFGLRLNLNIKNSFACEDSDILDAEVDSEIEYDSNDESSTINSANVKSDFAKRRSTFFKTFKPESLRLIPPPKDDKSKANQSTIKRENFSEKFEIYEKLGEGCHSIVRRCCKKGDSPLHSLAVKIIAYKDPEYLFEILQEERVLSLLNHRNIIKYDSFFLEKEKKKAYIVSEYACGKPLGQFIQNKRKFNMREIRSIAKQSLKAIRHMHSKGIIHRDLSYNNIMYDPQTETVKVIDFTVSKIVTIQKLLTNTGTLNFKAPEMLSGTFYSHSIDIFALGVNLYALIFGNLPFTDATDKKIIDNIINLNPLEFYKDQQNCDEDLLSFLEGLLEKNPFKRMTAQQSLKHPFLNQKITCDDFKSQRFRKNKKKGISASTVAEIDDDLHDQDTFTSINSFQVKTFANLKD